jgi:hypothetical protein
MNKHSLASAKTFFLTAIASLLLCCSCKKDNNSGTKPLDLNLAGIGVTFSGYNTPNLTTVKILGSNTIDTTTATLIGRYTLDVNQKIFIRLKDFQAFDYVFIIENNEKIFELISNAGRTWATYNRVDGLVNYSFRYRSAFYELSSTKASTAFIIVQKP